MSINVINKSSQQNTKELTNYPSTARYSFCGNIRISDDLLHTRTSSTMKASESIHVFYDHLKNEYQFYNATVKYPIELVFDTNNLSFMPKSKYPLIRNLLSIFKQLKSIKHSSMKFLVTFNPIDNKFTIIDNERYQLILWNIYMNQTFTHPTIRNKYSTIFHSHQRNYALLENFDTIFEQSGNTFHPTVDNKKIYF